MSDAIRLARRLTETAYNCSWRILITLRDGIGEGNVADFQVQFGLGRSAEDPCAIVVKFSFPARDDDGREAIADYVHARAGHVH